MVLPNAFHKSVQTVRLHARKCAKAMRIPPNRKRVGTIVNDDLSKWTSELFDVAIFAGAKWTSPPDVGLLPPVLVPQWGKTLCMYRRGRTDGRGSAPRQGADPNCPSPSQAPENASRVAVLRVGDSGRMKLRRQIRVRTCTCKEMERKTRKQQQQRSQGKIVWSR